MKFWGKYKTWTPGPGPWSVDWVHQNMDLGVIKLGVDGPGPWKEVHGPGPYFEEHGLWTWSTEGVHGPGSKLYFPKILYSFSTCIHCFTVVYSNPVQAITHPTP